MKMGVKLLLVYFENEKEIHTKELSTAKFGVL